ncbi:MAG: fibronectin type III-like domain-contianing protein, partial [Thermoproteota archaeon]
KGRIDKPFQELKGFHKTRLLNPGEKEKITVELDFDSLASYDGEKWVVEKGGYEVRVGASSRDIRLLGRFTIN